MKIHDPFFPAKGPSKAAILRRDPKFTETILWSHLHGGRKYRLARYANPRVMAKFPARGQTLPEGEAALTLAFQGASQTRQLIKATQGLGKTHAVVQAMSAFPGNVACFVRSHQNAEELAARLPADVRVIVVRGRKVEGMCRNLRRVEEAIKDEQVVPRDICPFCPFRDSCAYLEQTERVTKAARDQSPLVIVLPHSYLYTGIPGDPRIDWAVIDEMPSDLGTVQVEFNGPLKQSETVLKPMSMPKAGDSDGLGRWMAHGNLEIEARALADQILASPTLPVDLPEGVLKWPWKNRFRKLIHGLAESEEFPYRVWRQNGKLIVSRLKSLDLDSGLPLTVLDGTANVEIARKVFGQDLEFIGIPVERNADVTYVTGRTFSDSSITGESRDRDWSEDALRLRENLGLGFARYKTPFLAAKRGVLEALGWTGSKCHFGALRGVDKYIHHDRQAYDHGARLEVAERARFGHPERVGSRRSPLESV